ncbi:hypothetical protein SLEP1_g50298 [Rubroshorea leprosula]|uniref:Uncharacterized protein n=1 Tax=Rubroshorea leprosula TaxID=152421 RepID=A0AAV5LZJ3_9ROSI|nr:hypothetical protein SLEP1_g50298 [Rubroshorea leprosula]
MRNPRLGFMKPKSGFLAKPKSGFLAEPSSEFREPSYWVSRTQSQIWVPRETQRNLVVGFTNPVTGFREPSSRNPQGALDSSSSS